MCASKAIIFIIGKKWSCLTTCSDFRIQIQTIMYLLLLLDRQVFANCTYAWIRGQIALLELEVYFKQKKIISKSHEMVNSKLLFLLLLLLLLFHSTRHFSDQATSWQLAATLNLEVGGHSVPCNATKW